MVKKEPTTTEIMTAIAEMGSNFRTEMRTEMSEIHEVLEFMQEHMATKEDLKTTKVEIIDYVHAHMASKEDLERYATKDDMREFKSEVIDTLDHFTMTMTVYDHEITALRGGLNRHEERIETVETQLRAA